MGRGLFFGRMFVSKRTADQGEPDAVYFARFGGSKAVFGSVLESEQVVVTPSGLLASFATVPDPRRRQGTRVRFGGDPRPGGSRDSLQSPLGARHRRVGSRPVPRVPESLGFPVGVTPHQSTLQRLLRRLDPDALSDALVGHFAKA